MKNKPTILVVDDTPENIKVVVGILRNQYKVKAEIEGAAAIEIASNTPPDLILLDIMMPEMNGYEVCQQLKKSPKTQEIPIIFLTAKAETADIVKGFELGAVDYVTKPFNPTELLARVNTHLTIRRQKIQLAESEKIAAMTRVFEKFVPKQFLNRIAQEGIENIELGKAENDTMTILFSDIRSFTTLSENMTPQEVLNFLNSHFKNMNEQIRKHHGFVDKFIGDAVMALFHRPEGTYADAAQDAVQAAIDMQKAVQVYNQDRQKCGYQPISTGIGIHSGPAIIGTVGSEDRMDSTVLGDAVNLASRLEGLTKTYGIQIIISGETFSLLKDPSFFKFRELDIVTVKGKTEATKIYEIFDCDPPEIQELKSKTTSMITTGDAPRR